MLETDAPPARVERNTRNAHYQLVHLQEPPRAPFYRGASFILDVRGFVNGLCARDFMGHVLGAPHDKASAVVSVDHY